MKTLLITVLTLASLSSFANDRVVKSVGGCTDYLFASEYEHKRSAVEDYRANADRKCANAGYSSWTTIYSKWTPGINIRFMCVRGKVRCHD
ncbi:hypothetical protein M899_0538 [Bacteriovorax sp. BSW11_IV]|uniref:hypothetical protein n=1 Tax=Bacteriovorax sp. BSW11_IV TaxID=1353529 RepID=UPI00038A04BF|nr:hypothetical protein [Bacteriovorax sp. BSW11_IV]EQC45016.1 hypothetical protein M899_0538 [Bacteriovorax sp. BSW11_IV]